MDLWHFCSFLKTKKSRSLLRAAHTVHIERDFIIAQMKALEDQLGLRLFFRASRGFKLTEAGTQLQSHYREALFQSERELREYVEHLRDTHHILQLGFDSAAASNYLVNLFHLLTEHFERIHVRVVEQTGSELMQSLARGLIDVGIVTGACEGLPPAFEWVSVLERPGAILLSSRASFTAEGSLELASLQHLPLVILSDSSEAHLAEFALEACRRSDLQPDRVILVPNRMAMYSSITAQNGYGILPNGPELNLLPGEIKRYELPPCGLSIHTYAVWLQDGDSPSREPFVRLLAGMTGSLVSSLQSLQTVQRYMDICRSLEDELGALKDQHGGN